MSKNICPKLPDSSENLLAYQGTKFCICCLDRNKTFLISLTCEHASILERLTDITSLQAEFGPPLVCNECHRVLVKIKLFKDQVEANNLILKSKCPRIPVKSKNLSVHDIEIFDSTRTIAVKDEKVEIKIEPIVEEEDILDEDNTVCHNYTNDHDMVKPIPQFTIVQLSEQQKGITVKTFKEKLVERNETKKEIVPSQTSTHNEGKYEKKVKKIKLTEEEMREERKQYSMSEDFAKFKYKCNLCVTGFEHETKYNDHNQRKHTKKDGGLTCAVCQTVCTTQAAYSSHVGRHYKRYECKACGKRGTDLSNVVYHYNEVHEVKEPTNYVCEHCEFTTESQRKFKYHVEQHKGRPKCTECDRDFVSNSGLRQHMITIHKETKTTTEKHVCNQCGKSYKNRCGLKSHMDAQHSTGRVYCSLCKVYFKNEIQLQRHITSTLKHRIENGEKLQCKDCEAAFPTRITLIYHRKSAHNIHIYQCELCDKKYTSERNLRRHRESAHEKKRAPRNKICDHCGRGFTTNLILQAHIRTHTGERPFTCEHCSATFAHNAALYTHRKMVHGLKNQEAE